LERSDRAYRPTEESERDHSPQWVLEHAVEYREVPVGRLAVEPRHGRTQHLALVESVQRPAGKISGQVQPAQNHEREYSRHAGNSPNATTGLLRCRLGVDALRRPQKAHTLRSKGVCKHKNQDWDDHETREPDYVVVRVIAADREEPDNFVWIAERQADVIPK